MNWKIYRVFVGHSIQELFSYRLTTVLVIIFGLLFFILEMFAGLVYYQFADEIFGWTRLDYLSLICVTTLISSLYQLFFINGQESLSELVVEGELDYMFIRPINLFWYHALYRLDWPSSINAVIAIFVQAKLIESISVDLSQMFFYSLLVANGVWFLFLVNHVVVMSVFWLERISKLQGIPEYLVDLAGRPAAIYPKGVRWIMTWILPFFLAMQLPVFSLHKRVSGIAFIWLITLNGGLFMLVKWMWSVGIKRYASTN